MNLNCKLFCVIFAFFYKFDCVAFLEENIEKDILQDQPISNRKKSSSSLVHATSKSFSSKSFALKSMTNSKESEPDKHVKMATNHQSSTGLKKLPSHVVKGRKSDKSIKEVNASFSVRESELKSST